MNLENKITDIIHNNLSVIYEDIEIADDLDFIADLGFDSLSLMQLVLDLEEAFGIDFDEDSDYSELSTVSNFKEYVLKKIKDKEDTVND